MNLTSEQWQRAKDLFLKAIERPPEQRASFLRDACPDDPAVLHEAQAMLAQHHDDPSAPEDLLTVPTPPSQSLGSRIGPYKLIQQIGEGGMGVVYMAEQ